MILAQSGIEASGSLRGGNTKVFPVQLKQGDVLYIEVNSADKSLDIFITDPKGKETNRSPLKAIKYIFQAKLNGQHTIVTLNTNGMAVRYSNYVMMYSVRNSEDYDTLVINNSPVVLSASPATSPSGTQPNQDQKESINGLFIAAFIIIGIIVLMVVMLSGFRIRRNYYIEPESYNAAARKTRQRSDIERGMDWHVPKINKEGAEFISGASSLKKTQQDAMKKTKKNLWG